MGGLGKDIAATPPPTLGILTFSLSRGSSSEAYTASVPSTGSVRIFPEALPPLEPTPAVLCSTTWGVACCLTTADFPIPLNNLESK